jgi:hypothetical protein
MIDPPWFKPAVPTLRLGVARNDLLRAIIREDDWSFLRDADMFRALGTLSIPRLRGPIGGSKTKADDDC